MNRPDSFEVLVEASIALIGFAGVVVVLGRSQLSGEARRFRLVLLFVNGVAALWGALIPTFAGLVSGASDPWPLSALLYLPALIGVNAFAWWNFYVLLRAGQYLPRVFYIVTPLVVASLLYLLAALLLDQSQIPAAQFASVVLLLFLGLYHFFILTTSIHDEP